MGRVGSFTLECQSVISQTPDCLLLRLTADLRSGVAGSAAHLSRAFATRCRPKASSVVPAPLRWLAVRNTVSPVVSTVAASLKVRVASKVSPGVRRSSQLAELAAGAAVMVMVGGSVALAVPAKVRDGLPRVSAGQGAGSEAGDGSLHDQAVNGEV